MATALSAASEPRATSSCIAEEDPSEPWTSPTAGSEQWRLARALEPARASYHAPPPGNGAVGSGGEKAEGEVAGDGDSATGLVDAVNACFFFFSFRCRVHH